MRRSPYGLDGAVAGRAIGIVGKRHEECDRLFCDFQRVVCERAWGAE